MDPEIELITEREELVKVYAGIEKKCQMIEDFEKPEITEE